MGSWPTSAFERLIDYINGQGRYHPRTQDESNRLSLELLKDLYSSSRSFKADVDTGRARFKLNTPLHVGSRQHVVDLVFGVTSASPDAGEASLLPSQTEDMPEIVEGVPEETRLVIEHTSLITAHRNVLNRTRILVDVAENILSAPEYSKAVGAATFMIGTCEKYLSYETLKQAEDILAALCSKAKYPLEDIGQLLGTGDKRLKGFLALPGVSELLLTANKKNEPKGTLEKVVREIPLRSSLQETGFDAFMIQFCHIDNIDPPRLENPPYFLRATKFTQYRPENALRKIANLYDERFP